MKIRNAKSCAWDQVSLGEVMLRLDRESGGSTPARAFDIGEGGGVQRGAGARGARFGLRTAIVTALAAQPGRGG